MLGMRVSFVVHMLAVFFFVSFLFAVFFLFALAHASLV